MRRIIAIVACIWFVSPADAQTDQVAMLSKALAVLQQQRNTAMDQIVNAQVEAATLKETVSALQGEIANLKDELAAAKKERTP